MKTFKTKLSIATVIALSAVPNIASAESVTATASVRVVNAMEFREVKQLDFGAIKAFPNPNGANNGFVRVSANGGIEFSGEGDNGELMSVVEQGTPAEFELVGSAAHMSLQVKITGGKLYSEDNPDAPAFEMVDFDVYQPGKVANDEPSSEMKVIADASGSLKFNVGGTLRMIGDQDYTDGSYSGSYIVSIDY